MAAEATRPGPCRVVAPGRPVDCTALGRLSAFDESGNAVVGDLYNHVIPEIEAGTGFVRTIVGRITADDERSNNPTGAIRRN
jgi:hypothetical protein